MRRVLRRGRPDIFLYKHRFTRRYLNLDDAGHTYRYFPPRTHSGNGKYRRHRDPAAAIDALGLWEMPDLGGHKWTDIRWTDTPSTDIPSTDTPSTDIPSTDTGALSEPRDTPSSRSEA